MTKEEKQLLLIDLCGRLSHGVIVDYKENEFETPHWKIKTIYPETLDGWIGYDRRVGAGSESGSRPFKIGEAKPYLRPMSSMTEDEKKELKEISAEYLDKWMSVNDPSVRCELDAKVSSKRAEFYNSHHLDWNGLIGKGLALEALEGMYKND